MVINMKYRVVGASCGAEIYSCTPEVCVDFQSERGGSIEELDEAIDEWMPWKGAVKAEEVAT